MLPFFLFQIFSLFYFLVFVDFYFYLWIIFEWADRSFLHYFRFNCFLIWSKLKFIRRKGLVWVCLRDRNIVFILFSKCIPVIRSSRLYFLSISEFFYHISDARTLKPSFYDIILLRIFEFVLILPYWFVWFWSQFYLILNEWFFL